MIRKIQTKITLSLTTEQAERHAREIAASGLSQNKFVHKAIEDQVKLSKEVNELRETIAWIRNVIQRRADSAKAAAEVDEHRNPQPPYVASFFAESRLLREVLVEIGLQPNGEEGELQ